MQGKIGEGGYGVIFRVQSLRKLKFLLLMRVRNLHKFSWQQHIRTKRNTLCGFVAAESFVVGSQIDVVISTSISDYICGQFCTRQPFIFDHGVLPERGSWGISRPHEYVNRSFIRSMLTQEWNKSQYWHGYATLRSPYLEVFYSTLRGTGIHSQERSRSCRLKAIKHIAIRERLRRQANWFWSKFYWNSNHFYLKRLVRIYRSVAAWQTCFVDHWPIFRLKCFEANLTIQRLTYGLSVASFMNYAL